MLVLLPRKHSVFALLVAAFLAASLTMEVDAASDPNPQPEATVTATSPESQPSETPTESQAAQPAAAEPTEQPQSASENPVSEPELVAPPQEPASDSEPTQQAEPASSQAEPETVETPDEEKVVEKPEVLEPETTLSEAHTPFFKPDVLLGRIVTHNHDLVGYLRTLARESKLNLVVDGTIDIQLDLDITDPRTGINQLLNLLVHLYPIRCERIGSFVYVRPNPKPKQVNDLRYDPNADTLGVLLDGLTPRDFADQLIEVTGKNVFLDDSVRSLTDRRVKGTLAALPFSEALTELMRANQFGVKQQNNIFFIGRVPGVRVHEGLIDIWFENEPLGDVLHALAAEGAFPIMISSPLEGTVSVDLKGIPLERLLPLLVADSTYRYHRRNGVHVIGGESSVVLNETRVVRFEKLHVGLVPNMLPEGLLKQVEMVAVKETNSLLITGHPTQVANVAEVVAQLDQVVPQVLLEVYIVKYTDTDALKLGLNLGNGDNQYFPNLDLSLDGFRDSGNNFQIVRLPSDFKIKLDMLQNNDRARVVTQPRIAALSGNEASLVFGSTLHYRIQSEEIVGVENPRVRTTEKIQSVDANTLLKITPWVIDQNTTTIDIYTEFNDFKGVVEENVPPELIVNTLRSSVRLRNGETVVLGGLMVNTQDRKDKSLPGISKVPLLGALFKNRDWKTLLNETVIYITPHIYYGGEESPEYIEDKRVLDYRFSEVKKMNRQEKRAARRAKRDAKKAAKLAKLRALAPQPKPQKTSTDSLADPDPIPHR